MVHDAQLLDRYARESSQEAFAELVQRHLPLVFRTAARQMAGDSHGAQDVAQQVFTLVARRAGALSKHPNFVGWLYMATCHTVRNARRAERRRAFREQIALAMTDDPGEYAEAFELDRTRVALDEAMLSLSECDRQAILLRFFKEQPFAEVGRVLRVSEDGARMRVARAVEKLRAVLLRRGIASSSAALSGLLASEGAIAAPGGLAAVITTSAVTNGGAALAVGFLSFMSTTKAVTALAAVALTVALGTVAYQRNRAREAEGALRAAQQTHDELRARISASERRAAEARAEAIAAQESPAPKHTQSPAAWSDQQAEAAGRAFLVRHPTVARAMLEQRRAVIAGAHLPLYRELKLTDAQIAEFEQILLDGPASSVVYGANGSPKMRLAVGAGRTASETSKRLLMLLGHEGYEKFMGGQFSLVGSKQVDVAAALHFTDAPLTAEQGRALAKAMAEERWSPANEQAPGVAEYWARVADRLKNVLSREQCDALKLLQYREEYEAARRLAAQSIAGRDGGGTP